jgi:hypothetical protein
MLDAYGFGGRVDISVRQHTDRASNHELPLIVDLLLMTDVVEV